MSITKMSRTSRARPAEWGPVQACSFLAICSANPRQRTGEVTGKPELNKTLDMWINEVNLQALRRSEIHFHRLPCACAICDSNVEMDSVDLLHVSDLILHTESEFIEA